MIHLLQSSLCLIAIALATVGCKDRQTSSTPPPEPTPTEAKAELPPDATGAPPPSTRKAAMQKHFAQAIAAKDTLLFGDLDATLRSLEWLAKYGASDSSLEPWEPHLGRVRAIATSATATRDAQRLAMAVAQIARECGACHATLGIEPGVPLVTSAPKDLSFRDHMIGHKWALDRMWAGLTTPSDLLWKSGAEYLAASPEHLRKLSSYGDQADKAMDLASDIHRLAGEATTEEQPERQMVLLGKFLGACAGCHALPRIDG